MTIVNKFLLSSSSSVMWNLPNQDVAVLAHEEEEVVCLFIPQESLLFGLFMQPIIDVCGDL